WHDLPSPLRAADRPRLLPATPRGQLPRRVRRQEMILDGVTEHDREGGSDQPDRVLTQPLGTSPAKEFFDVVNMDLHQLVRAEIRNDVALQNIAIPCESSRSNLASKRLQPVLRVLFHGGPAVTDDWRCLPRLHDLCREDSVRFLP